MCLPPLLFNISNFIRRKTKYSRIRGRYNSYLSVARFRAAQSYLGGEKAFSGQK